MENRTLPWQMGEPLYPTHSRILEPAQMARVINRAKRPLVVVGSLLKESKIDLLNYVIGLSKARNWPVVASPNLSKDFLTLGFKPTAIMSVLELVNLIVDPKWQGFDEKAQYDLLIFLGVLPLLANQAFFTTKHFAEVIAISIGQYYEPNATFSFPNLTDEEWLLW